MRDDGNLSYAATNVNASMAVRPVLSLNYDVLIIKGDGSVTNPFVVDIPAPAEPLTVTYVANGAVIGRTNDECSEISCEFTTPTITRAGGNVIGWSMNPNATTAEFTAGQSVTFTESTTLYAITSITHTATFNANGATSIGATSRTCTRWNAQASCSILAPSITRANFDIIGWNTTAGATTSVWNVGAARITVSNQTFFAITRAQTPPNVVWNCHVSCAPNWSGSLWGIPNSTAPGRPVWITMTSSDPCPVITPCPGTWRNPLAPTGGQSAMENVGGPCPAGGGSRSLIVQRPCLP